MITKDIVRSGFIVAGLIFITFISINFIHIANSTLVWLSPVMESLFVTGSLIIAYLLISRGLIAKDKWALIIGLAFLSTIIPTITWLLAYHNFRGQSIIPTPPSTHIWILYFRDLTFALVFMILTRYGNRRTFNSQKAIAYVVLISLATSIFISTPPFLPDIIQDDNLLPINTYVTGLLLALYTALTIYTLIIYRRTKAQLLLIFIVFILIYGQGLFGFALSGSRFDIEWYFGKAVNIFAFGILITYLITEYTGYFIDSLVASSLQLSLAPKMPEVDWLQIDAQYRPAIKQAAVGGDWYDVISQESGKITVIVGDAIGKGVDAIPTMTEAKFLLRGYLLEGMHATEALGKVNNYLVKYLGNEEFVTLAIGTIDPSTRTIQYALAGHPPPILITKKGWEFLKMQQPKLPLGIAKDIEYNLESAPLNNNDVISFYSDGVIEARRENIFFEDQGLVKFLQENRFASSKEINLKLLQILSLQWLAIDDITSVIVKIKF